MATAKTKPKAKKKAASQVEARAAYVETILDANEYAITFTVGRMVDVMQRMAPQVPEEFHVWLAVRLLVAAAQWDIRISDFKAPKKRCIRCGKKV